MLDFYKKKELAFAIVIIVIYCLLGTIATRFNNMIGVSENSKLFQMIFTIALVVALFIFIFKNNLKEKYGLNKANISINKIVFYVLFLLIATRNLWFGFKMNMALSDTIVYVIYMFFVGICEELIFRGFLFKAIEKDSKKEAIIITSLTFAIGHFVNLFNGENLLSNVMTVAGAIGYGFLMVSLLLNTKSLIPAIIMHSITDMLSAFANMDVISPTIRIISLFIFIIQSVIFSYILLKNSKETITEKQKV